MMPQSHLRGVVPSEQHCVPPPHIYDAVWVQTEAEVSNTRDPVSHTVHTQHHTTRNHKRRQWLSHRNTDMYVHHTHTLLLTHGTTCSLCTPTWEYHTNSKITLKEPKWHVLPVTGMFHWCVKVYFLLGCKRKRRSFSCFKCWAHFSKTVWKIRSRTPTKFNKNEPHITRLVIQSSVQEQRHD